MVLQRVKRLRFHASGSGRRRETAIIPGIDSEGTNGVVANESGGMAFRDIAGYD
jgi:hypothetical protein